MTRYLGVLEYDGTGFCGSQVQAGQRSVQGEVEAALGRLNGQASPVLFAGRTDAGVHAIGQVVGLDLGRQMTGRELADALNGLMGRDVSVREAAPVAAGFHPRFWAVARRYQYRVLAREQRRAVDDRYVWHVSAGLDVDAIAGAAGALVGRYDFGSFGRPPQGDNTWRTVKRLDVERSGDEIRFTVEADAFLRRMVRTIVGTLIDVGRGRLTGEDVLALRDRRDAPAVGAAAPAKGLALVAVAYDRERLGRGVGDGEPASGRPPHSATASRLRHWWSTEPVAGAW